MRYTRAVLLIRTNAEFRIIKPNPDKARTTYGIDGFQKRLEGLIADVETDLRKCPHILMVADNDDDPAKQFERVAKQIKTAGWTKPTAPRTPTAGPEGLPQVSVLMLPWDDEPGCLETLCYQSAAAQRKKHAGCVAKFVKCVKAEDWPISKLSKLQMRALITSVCKHDPYTGLQWAWTAREGRPDDLIPLSHKCFDRLADYLKDLRASCFS